MSDYFSDRERGPRPRTEERLSDKAWKGLRVLIDSRIADGSFGYGYPQECPDGGNVIGCDRANFFAALEAEVPGIEWNSDTWEISPVEAVMDALEFCHRAVAEAQTLSRHPFYGNHRHLGFMVEKGQAKFVKDVNRVLVRNGMAYTMRDDGLIERVLPEGLHQILEHATVRTGDADLNRLLEAARAKIMDRNVDVRHEALEKLWDAWERLKTLQNPEVGKKDSANALLDKAAKEPELREELGKEAMALTRIGNEFHIRHTEVGKPKIEKSAQVDYLFHRLFALIWLLLRASGRCE